MGGSNGPPLLGLLGIGDDQMPARVDLEGDLELVAVTAQVGVTGLVVVALDVVDRKLLGR